MARKPYVKGEYKVMCDICGSVRYASQTRMNWKGERVCSDTCWEPRNPQEMPIIVPKERTCWQLFFHRLTVAISVNVCYHMLVCIIETDESIVT